MITTDIDTCAEILSQNDLVAIPTETVYGLAGNAFEETAVNKIFKLKQRPKSNPLIVHIKSIDYLPRVAVNIPQSAWNLIYKFWPGPLTLILNKSPLIPDCITAGLKDVAVRIPNHPKTLELLHKIDFPLAAPSANPFNSISPTRAQHVDNYFGSNLKAILEGESCKKGIESTIVGFENENPIIYRLGSLETEEIEKVAGTSLLKNQALKNQKAPGMLPKHYSPATPTLLTNNLQKEVQLHKDKRIGILAFNNTIDSNQAEVQISLSRTGDLEEAAANLYDSMHQLDNHELDLIIVEKLPNAGLGLTINDKLIRASYDESIH